MKKLDLQNVTEATEREKLTANGYVCKIITTTDKPDKEYLEMEIDIAEGKFKDYYARLMEQFNFWGGKLIRSYKDAALGFFKGFTTAVENSNLGFKYIDGEEQDLNGKLVGIVFREEEYLKNSGEIGTRVKPDEIRSVDKIRKSDFKIKPLKKLEAAAPTKKTIAEGKPIEDDDLPF